MNEPCWNPDFLKTSPLFEPLRSVSDNLEKLCYWPDYTDLTYLIQSLPKRIVTLSGKSVCFVPQQKQKTCVFEEQYEVKIYLTGAVQTRLHNWHDLFNALVWTVYPKAKAQLNYLHYRVLLQAWRDEKIKRGLLRDALTLFDESGVVVVSNNRKLIKLLECFEWKALFWEHRVELIKCMKFFIFGHGLYEKALNPYVGMTGQGIIFSVVGWFFEQPVIEQINAIDLMLADYFHQHTFSSKYLHPVPVLGFPGWSPDNGAEGYYHNCQYFRARSAGIIKRK